MRVALPAVIINTIGLKIIAAGYEQFDGFFTGFCAPYRIEQNFRRPLPTIHSNQLHARRQTSKVCRRAVDYVQESVTLIAAGKMNEKTE